MKASRLVLMAAILVGTATAGMARDVCLFDGGTYLVYQKVKPLRPNRATPLIGYAVGPFGTPQFTCPLHGTAIMTANGSVQVGNDIYCGSEPGFGHYNTQHSAHTDSSFAGSYDADSNGDGVSDYQTTYELVDCKTVVTYP
jgi:hypothetical protein